MNKEILKTVEAYLLTNKDFLSESEIRGLEKQIMHLKQAIYLDQLKAFKKHMSECFDSMMGDDCTDESVDSFYTSDFKIAWRGKTVTLTNGADVFQGIEEVLQIEIDECEGVY